MHLWPEKWNTKASPFRSLCPITEARRSAPPVYTIRRDGAVVHEDAVQEKFADEIAAEDAAYSEAREWIDAKCQVN